MAKRDEFGETAHRGREIVVLAITLGAAALFVALGGNSLSAAPDTQQEAARAGIVLTALLLNVALILLGWKRQRDLAAYNRTANRARLLATHDPLTGLRTHRQLLVDGNDLLALADRRGKAVALMLCDIDDLKDVNNRHGIETGDALLVRFAGLLGNAAPAQAIIARFDGDRFAATFLYDPHLPNTVDSAIDRLCAAMAENVEVNGLTLPLRATIGAARSDQARGSMESLLLAAEQALANARAAGGGRQAWFDGTIASDDGSAALLQALTGAVERGEFEPFFDRQIDLATGALVGFEVLARWHNPVAGTLPASRFLPLADRKGMTGAITFDVLRQALIAARDWDPGLTLSVNIGAGQLKDPWLAQKLVKLLTEAGFPAQRIEIEITEAALIDNLALARSLVESLRTYGVRLALDDFGSGWSSLTQLRALPFDRIKIDHALIGRLDGDADAEAIVRAIASLAESLRLPVTAEGIASEDMRDMLRALGCATGQGRYWGEPMPVTHARRLLAQHSLLRRSA